MYQHSNTAFVVLGAGAWGGALALHLARQGQRVVLWGNNPASKVMDYLPGIIFCQTISLTHNLEEAFYLAGDNPVVLIVVPSIAFDEVTKQIQPYLKPTTPILWGTKGLSAACECLDVVCKRNTGDRPMGVLSGPSFAMEVAKGLPTAITLATHSTKWGVLLQKAIHGKSMRVYLSTDLVGVQLGGVVKNIIAIAVGMSDGLGYGANARAALITRGLAELKRLGQALGAQSETFMGLSGVGDMVLTCTDNQSRNRRFGIALGEGRSSTEAAEQVGKVVEGKLNVKQVMTLAKQYQLELPICENVEAVLFHAMTPQQAVMNLLMRPPKKEG